MTGNAGVNGRLAVSCKAARQESAGKYAALSALAAAISANGISRGLSVVSLRILTKDGPFSNGNYKQRAPKFAAGIIFTRGTGAPTAKPVCAADKGSSTAALAVPPKIGRVGFTACPSRIPAGGRRFAARGNPTAAGPRRPLRRWSWKG